jgi:ABC-type lipopolysaccharide export system ATPase subunit
LVSLPRYSMIQSIMHRYEPSLGLSPKLLTSVFEKITEINRSNGVTILIVEQKVREVLEICNRVYSDIIAQKGLLEDGVNFVNKPFSMDDLALKVREVLDKG